MANVVSNPLFCKHKINVTTSSITALLPPFFKRSAGVDLISA